jgi:hypothetical protein
MKKLTLLAVLFILACNPPTTNTGGSTPPPPPPPPPTDTTHVVVVTNEKASYMAMGTVSMYQTAMEAYDKRASNRPYYFEQGIVAQGVKVYNTKSTTTPFEGNDLWICVSFDGGHNWKSIQVDNSGTIILVQ